MARVRMLHDWTFRHTRHCMTAYKAGKEYTVTNRCAEAAIKAKAAERRPAPPRREVRS